MGCISVSLRKLEGVDLIAGAVSLLKSKGVETNLFVLSSESGRGRPSELLHGPRYI